VKAWGRNGLAPRAERSLGSSRKGGGRNSVACRARDHSHVIGSTFGKRFSNCQDISFWRLISQFLKFSSENAHSFSEFSCSLFSTWRNPTGKFQLPLYPSSHSAQTEPSIIWWISADQLYSLAVEPCKMSFSGGSRANELEVHHVLSMIM
jgi:hypothetical protein